MAQIEAFRRRHGLNKPLVERYQEHVVGLARGDLGSSYRQNIPVSTLIATRLPRTLLLGVLALLFELLLGVSIGVMAGVYKRTWLDALAMSFTWLGVSMPAFIVGLLMLNIFAFRLGWFPVGGYGVTATDHFFHALLPALTLSMLGAASYARVMRGEMLETLQADFVRTAKAKGLSRWSVLTRHAVRNAIIPVVTLAGLQIGGLASGAVITETLFGWPGMGRLAVESITTPDYPVILGTVLVGCVFVLAGNTLADVASAALDPRVRET